MYLNACYAVCLNVYYTEHGRSLRGCHCLGSTNVASSRQWISFGCWMFGVVGGNLTALAKGDLGSEVQSNFSKKLKIMPIHILFWFSKLAKSLKLHQNNFVSQVWYWTIAVR